MTKALKLAFVAAAFAVSACDSEGEAPPVDPGAEAPAEEDPEQVADPVQDDWSPVEGAGPQQLLMAVDTIGFAEEQEPGIVPGFDVDGKTSNAGDAETCFQPDFVSPSGEPGIDNQFAIILPGFQLVGLGPFQQLLQNSIDEGGLLIMWELSGVDDLENDDEVTLTYRLGEGTPLLGTDGLLLSGQTFEQHPESPEQVLPGARIEDGVLKAGPFAARIPAVVFGVQYEIGIVDAYFEGRLTYDGGMESGLIGGGVPMSDIMDIAVVADTMDGGILDAVTALFSGLADLAQNEEGECTQLSAAVVFTAVSAYIAE